MTDSPREQVDQLIGAALEAARAAMVADVDERLAALRVQISATYHDPDPSLPPPRRRGWSTPGRRGRGTPGRRGRGTTAAPLKGSLDWVQPAGPALADFEQARDTAGDGGVVYVPAGAYRFASTLKLNAARQWWIVHPNAVFTIAGNAALLQISGAGTLVEGGVWDGNKGNISGGHATVNIVGDRCGIRKAEVRNGDYSNVRIAGCDHAFVESCYVHDATAFDIYVEPSSRRATNYARVLGNTVENSGSEAGIHARGDNQGTLQTHGTRIASNHVTRLGADHAEIGIEVWGYAPFSTVVNNHVTGAWMCVSVDKCDHSTVTGNTGDNCKWGYELAGSSHCTVTGNTVDCRNIAGSIGVTCSNANNGINTISANNIDRARRGIHLNGSNGNNAPKYVVSGNTIDRIPGDGGVGIYCQNASHVAITGNQLHGVPDGGGRAILCENTNNVAATGNVATNLSEFIEFYVSRSQTLDNYTICGNLLSGIDKALTTGQASGQTCTLGTHITCHANIGLADR